MIGAAWGGLAGRWRWIFFLWLACLLFALPLALPITRALESDLAPSLVSASMRQGGSYRWFADWKRARPGFLGDARAILDLRSPSGVESLDEFAEMTGLAVAAAALAVAYMAWSALAGGGLLATIVRRGEPASSAIFWNGAGTLFRRQLLSAALLFTLAWQIYRWLFVGTHDLMMKMTGGNPSDWTTHGVTFIQLLLLLCAWSLAWMWIDYSRLLMARQGRGLLHGLWGGLRLLAARFRPLAGAWLTGSAPAALAGVAWLGLTWRWDPAEAYGIHLLFAAQQLYVLSRLAARAFCWSACDRALDCCLPLRADKGDPPGRPAI